MNIFPPNGYDHYWKQVDSLQQQGLPKSALEIVNKLHEKAKSEKNPGQLVKAVIHRLKFTAYTEEDAFVLSLIDLKKEAIKADYPASPILHSMLAQMYWGYYQQNRYRFLNRTATQDFEADDIRTWDLRKVVENVQMHYALSLEKPEKLRQTSVEVYEAILYQGANGRAHRPTLYDFLAHRAIDFYTSSESALTQPADQFLIREEAYFAPADQFATYQVSTTDTLSFTFQATRLFQDLLQFRLQENNLAALLEVDLERLSYVLQQSVHPNKAVLYQQALQALEKKYENSEQSAEVSYWLAYQLYQNSQKYNPLQSDEHQWEAKQAYELCGKAISRFPKSHGAQNCRNLQAIIETKDLQLTLEKVNLPNEAFRGLVSFKNVDKLFVRVIKTSEEEFKKIHGKDEYSYGDAYKEKIIQFYAAKKPLHQFELNLPNAGDYQKHATEFRIPGAAAGDYIVLAGTSPSLSFKSQAVAYDFVTLSSLSYLHRKLDSGEVEFYVTHRQTGAPLPGVNAQLFSKEYDYKAEAYVVKKGREFTTDQQGYFKVPSPKKYQNFEVEFTHQGDRLTTSDRFNADAYRNSFYQDTPYPKDTATHDVSFYFTDRAIYRPGQPIYFKGILLSTDGNKFNQLRKKYPVYVTLYDVNGQDVAHLNLTTNEFGTFSGSFTAPTSGLNGAMHISDGYGTANFSVEDYKRPTFEVVIPAIQGSFRLGNEVKVKGQAQAFSGANIDQAGVKFRVVRNANFPYWWYCWKGYYPSSPAMEILNGVTKTDDQGGFEIIFNAIPDFSVPK
ncbi:MAG: MG2 domain-containing protein, partial [Bacteroidota bacterium]